MRLRALLLSIVFTASVLTPPRAHAAAMREFILSCTYGVLAGTMMGAATLAFTERPSDHLYRVARGASLGLYAGILLGAYVVFLVPDENSQDEEPLPEGLGWNRSFQLNSNHVVRVAMRGNEPRFELRPELGDRGGVSGASMHYSVYRF
jgi:hypothetical protein